MTPAPAAAELTTAGILSSGPQRPRPAFALTPLADIMFQLLIFFMLSTSLAPYSLLPLGGRAAADAETVAETPPGDPPPALAEAVTGPAIWHLGRGQIRAGRAWFDLAELPSALAALADAGVEDILLFVTDTANLQDLASVLEAVQAGGVARLQLMGR